MQPFVCTLLFEIEIEGFPHLQFDEQRLLIYSDNAINALKKAAEKGKKESETFYNVKSKKVEWKFLGITTFLSPANGGIISLDGATYRPQNPNTFKKHKLNNAKYIYQPKM